MTYGKTRKLAQLYLYCFHLFHQLHFQNIIQDNQNNTKVNVVVLIKSYIQTKCSSQMHYYVRCKNKDEEVLTVNHEACSWMKCNVVSNRPIRVVQYADHTSHSPWGFRKYYPMDQGHFWAVHFSWFLWWNAYSSSLRGSWFQGKL